jgi:hypothetical protein
LGTISSKNDVARFGRGRYYKSGRGLTPTSREPTLLALLAAPSSRVNTRADAEPPMPSSVVGAPLATSERLILAVVRAAREARTTTPELRDAVCDYVSELKERGYPPERVLVVVKALVAEAGIRKGRMPAVAASLDPETEIIERVVAWCIEDYFPASAD